MPFNLGDLQITKITLEGVDVPDGPLGTAEVFGTGEATTDPVEIPLNKFANYWRLESDAQDFVSDKHGVLNEVTFQSTSLGNAATFTGDTTCNMELPFGVLTSDTYVGVSYLFRTNDQSKIQRLLGLNNNGSTKPFVNTQIQGGSLSVKIHTGDYLVADGLNTSVFVHVLLQATEGGAQQLFINGLLVYSGEIVNFSEVIPKGNFIGASRTGFSLNLDGQMRGVSVYNEVVTPGEVLAIATDELAGNQIF